MIYLLRHGVAEPKSGEDAKRRLTAEGKRQSEAAGRALAALGAPVEACLTSPKLRASETAELACEALEIPVEIVDSLAGGAFDALELSAGRGAAMLVGHEPDFSNEIARLTGAKAKLRKGGLAIVDGNTLLALLRPQELAAIAALGNQARA